VRNNYDFQLDIAILNSQKFNKLELSLALEGGTKHFLYLLPKYKEVAQYQNREVNYFTLQAISRYKLGTKILIQTQIY